MPGAVVWTPAQALGHLRGTSFARPDLFGGCHDRFETEVLELLERYSERVGLVQDEMSTVLPARRPEGKA
ncbi:hypothetical protein AMK24_21870 [Streptomyces sp. CB02366]|nr:hypothetical protein AMK24_21870 [Streptomyces sp. CB02366]